jgi:hypothetical protein
VLLLDGQVLVTTLAGQTVTLSQAGTSVTIFLNGTVVGPTVWAGSVYVDFASTNFPYFPPVTSFKRRAAVTPPVRTVTPAVPEPRRFGRRGYRLTSHEQETPRVRVWHHPRHERHRGETTTYPKKYSKAHPNKTYPNKTYSKTSSKPSSSSRRSRHY